METEPPVAAQTETEVLTRAGEQGDTSASPQGTQQGRETYNIVLQMHTALGILGILSNGLVILVFGTHNKLRKKTPIKFILNQVRN